MLLNSKFNLKFDVEDKDGLIKKVYLVVVFQFHLILYFVSLVALRQECLEWIKSHFLIYLLCLIALPVILLIAFLNKQHVKKEPNNYLYVISFTIIEGYLIACLCSSISPGFVLMGVLMVFLTFLGLLVFAAKKENMPLSYRWALTSTLTFTILPTIAWFIWWPEHILYQLSYLLAAHLLSLYVMFKSKRIVKKYKMNEYVVATLFFYKDLVEVFVCLFDLVQNVCCSYRSRTNDR